MVARLLLTALACLSALPAQQPQSQSIIKGPMVIFIGPPGAGKTTHSERASKELGLPILSADWLIKTYPQAFARTQENKISGMEPQSDPALNKLFSAEVTRPLYAQGLIVDGYPATKDHADYIAKFVQRGELPAPVIIQLEIPDDTVRKRLPAEAGPALEQRIKDYHREMDMLRLYFPNAKVHTLDATRKIDRVFSDVNKVLKANLPKK